MLWKQFLLIKSVTAVLEMPTPSTFLPLVVVVFEDELLLVLPVPLEYDR